MEATLRELADSLDPPMNERQVTALLAIAGIEPCGRRYTGAPGHPAHTYDTAMALAAHAVEAARTAKQFTDSDWIASALLGREIIHADTTAGILRWTDGTRAEELGPGNYGRVRVGQCFVPAHRVIWIAAEGEIPPYLQINHLNRLRWDNRRANLELVTFGSNIRHAHGTSYRNYHDAVAELAELETDPTPPPGIDPYGGSMVCGRVIAAPTAHRPGR